MTEGSKQLERTPKRGVRATLSSASGRDRADELYTNLVALTEIERVDLTNALTCLCRRH